MSPNGDGPQSAQAGGDANDESVEEDLEFKHMDGAALQARIDAAGLGPFQALAVLATGGVMFSEGSEVLVMGSITTLLEHHWGLSALMRGAMVAIVFVGFACGNLLSGYIGDNFGRRRAILLGYSLIGCLGFLTGLAWHPAAMVAMRFGVGLGCGIGFPSVYSLIPEVCPTSTRAGMSTLMIGFMPAGELYAALMVLAVDPTLSHADQQCAGDGPYPNLIAPTWCTWRTMCELSALPAFTFLLISWFALPESPHWLRTQGRFEELGAVLDRMEAMNGKVRFRGPGQSPQVSVPNPETPVAGALQAALPACGTGLHPASKSYAEVIGRLLTPPMRQTVTFMFLAHFTKDFSVFGFGYVLPQFFHSLESLSVGAHLTMMAALSFPGVLLALALTRTEAIGHIRSMQMCALLCAVPTLGMLEATRDLAGAPCAFLAKSAAMAYFVCTVVYTAEVFPTDVRNTAVGLCTCMGRFGSILAPLLFELASGSFDLFVTVIMTLMTTVALLAGVALTVETKGRLLDSSTPLMPACPRRFTPHDPALLGPGVSYGALDIK